MLSAGTTPNDVHAPTVVMVSPFGSTRPTFTPLCSPYIAPREFVLINFNGPVIVSPDFLTNVLSTYSCKSSIASSMSACQLDLMTVVPTLSSVRSVTHSTLRNTFVRSTGSCHSWMIKSCRLISMIFSLKYPLASTVSRSSVVLYTNTPVLTSLRLLLAI